MGKVRDEGVGGVEVGRIKDGIECPSRQHKADDTKGNLDEIEGYRGHGRRKKRTEMT